MLLTNVQTLPRIQWGGPGDERRKWCKQFAEHYKSFWHLQPFCSSGGEPHWDTLRPSKAGDEDKKGPRSKKEIKNTQGMQLERQHGEVKVASTKTLQTHLIILSVKTKKKRCGEDAAWLPFEFEIEEDLLKGRKTDAACRSTHYIWELDQMKRPGYFRQGHTSCSTFAPALHLGTSCRSLYTACKCVGVLIGVTRESVSFNTQLVDRLGRH